jgi:hypothetical protein
MLTGPSSYIPTTEEFLNHWGAVNTALPPASPFTIPGEPLGFTGPVTRAVLQGLYDGLLAQQSVVQTAIMDDDLARESLVDQKNLMLDKLNQFNAKVRGSLPGTKWERRLPAVPGFGESRSKFCDPMESALNLWRRINNDSALGQDAELLLRDNYIMGDFESDLNLLRTAYQQLGLKDDTLALEREERNDIQDKIQPVLKQYRILMPTFFKPDNALVDSLPLLSPTGGHTPEPVTATGAWDAAQGKGKITWTASTDADLDHYEVRWSPGTEYHADDESTLGNIQPGGALEFLTDKGLAEAGAKSLFRVCVVLKQGNERGSEPVSVTRP